MVNRLWLSSLNRIEPNRRLHSPNWLYKYHKFRCCTTCSQPHFLSNFEMHIQFEYTFTLWLGCVASASKLNSNHYDMATIHGSVISFGIFGNPVDFPVSGISLEHSGIQSIVFTVYWICIPPYLSICELNVCIWWLPISIISPRIYHMHTVALAPSFKKHIWKKWVGGKNARSQGI